MHTLRTGFTVVCSALIHVSANAGDVSPIIQESGPEPASNGDWCEWLSNKPGTLYKNADNPYIQEFAIGGRFQWNAAYLSGENTAGYQFSDTHTEVRRFRISTTLKFLNYFTVKAYANMVDDASNRIVRWPGGQKLGWGYENFDQAHITFDAKKAFGIDSVDGLNLMYGRLKNEITHEGWTSSKKLLTVERSAIANKVYGGLLPTGVSLNVVKGDWDFWASVYSTDARTQFGVNTEFIGGWNDGLAYRVGTGYKASDDLNFRWDFIYNDAEGKSGDDSLFRYKWATSLSAEYDQDEWGLITDFIYGDNGGPENGVLLANRQGDFWAAVVMPYCWIVEDKLQGIVRYQYQGSSNSRGARIYSRYTRANHGAVANAGMAGGRGNEHHSLYAGVNYYVCGHNVKLQAGVEYEWMNVPNNGSVQGDINALTSWFGFRSYF